ncbi:MAG: sugar-binding transcriptional regulator [Pseudomonadota bacterium]
MSARAGHANEDELAARAAWLHFIGGLTQSEVARRLDLSVAKAHRHIARAQDDGLVRIFVDVESADCALLENRLIEGYGLGYCRVAMDAPEPGPLPLRALSAVGADFIQKAIESKAHEAIAFGNGRTLSACVDALPRMRTEGVAFVSLLGGLTRSFAANPYDVIHKLAAKTGAESYLMPLPLFANSPEDREVMMAQTGVEATTDLIARASLVVIGIGDASSEGGAATALARRGADDMARLREAGARAELLGRFVSADGASMKTDLDACVTSPDLAALKGREVVAIAGGAQKTEAIEAALKTGLLTGLIVDERTARTLVDRLEDAAQAATAAE